jgi:ABC-type xylose transport system permease subunit
MYLRQKSNILLRKYSARMYLLEVNAMKEGRNTKLSLKSIKRKSLNNAEMLLLITISLFVIIYIISAIVFSESNFAKYSVFFNLLNNKAYLLLLALGLTIVLISGSIDISVGGVTGLVSMVIATMLLNNNVSWICSRVFSCLYGDSALHCNFSGYVFRSWYDKCY